jgi:hypothetical protein
MFAGMNGDTKRSRKRTKKQQLKQSKDKLKGSKKQIKRQKNRKRRAKEYTQSIDLKTVEGRKEYNKRITAIERAQLQRNPAHVHMDLRLENQDTGTPMDDEIVESWLISHGSADIEGIDTPNLTDKENQLIVKELQEGTYNLDNLRTMHKELRTEPKKHKVFGKLPEEKTLNEIESDLRDLLELARSPTKLSPQAEKRMQQDIDALEIELKKRAKAKPKTVELTTKEKQDIRKKEQQKEKQAKTQTSIDIQFQRSGITEKQIKDSQMDKAQIKRLIKRAVDNGMEASDMVDLIDFETTYEMNIKKNPIFVKNIDLDYRKDDLSESDRQFAENMFIKKASKSKNPDSFIKDSETINEPVRHTITKAWLESPTSKRGGDIVGVDDGNRTINLKKFDQLFDKEDKKTLRELSKTNNIPIYNSYKNNVGSNIQDVPFPELRKQKEKEFNTFIKNLEKQDLGKTERERAEKESLKKTVLVTKKQKEAKLKRDARLKKKRAEEQKKIQEFERKTQENIKKLREKRLKEVEQKANEQRKQDNEKMAQMRENERKLDAQFEKKKMELPKVRHERQEKQQIKKEKAQKQSVKTVGKGQAGIFASKKEKELTKLRKTFTDHQESKLKRKLKPSEKERVHSIPLKQLRYLRRKAKNKKELRNTQQTIDVTNPAGFKRTLEFTLLSQKTTKLF